MTPRGPVPPPRRGLIADAWGKIMRAMRCTAALTALLAAAVIAGCGGTAPTATSAPAPEPASPAGAAAVAACRQAVAAQSSLPASTRAKLEGECEKAAGGDTAAVKKVAREVCEEAVRSAGVPAPLLEKALGTCRKAEQ